MVIEYWGLGLGGDFRDLTSTGFAFATPHRLRDRRGRSRRSGRDRLDESDRWNLRIDRLDQVVSIGGDWALWPSQWGKTTKHLVVKQTDCSDPLPLVTGVAHRIVGRGQGFLIGTIRTAGDTS